MNRKFRNYFFVFGIIPLLVFSNSTIFPNIKIVKYERGIIVNGDSINIKIEVITPTIIHVVASPTEFSINSSLIITQLMNPTPNWELDKFENEICINTDSLFVSFSPSTGNIQFYKNNNLILKEAYKSFCPAELEGEKAFCIKQTFNIGSDEALFGLGQHYNKVFNYRNKSIELIQSNTEAAIPLVVSTNNYGILWDNYSRTIFSDDSSGMSFQSDIGGEIDYYFIYAANLDGIISQYRKLTGQAPLFSKWAYGYFQSRNRYWTQEELLNTVEKYRSLSIPLDVIVLDYLHWGEYGFGSFQFDELNFPTPKQMVDSLHNSFNCKIMVSVWPSFSKHTPNWDKMNSMGYLLDVNSYENTQVYDAYNPDAGELYWELLNESYFDMGVDGWWLDATEPERMSEYINSKNFLGESKRYLNTYSLLDVKNIYTGQRNSSLNKRVFILTRSAFAGQQKYAAATWSGDIKPTFESLRSTITAGLNFCMSGIPYWTADIGGYKGGDPDEPAYRELYIRWFQYGTFCPIFRAHGRRAPGDRKTPNAVWSYGENTQEILTKYINLRYRLLPYIYSKAWEITNEGSSLLRALVFDFKHDKNVLNIDNQFMFGSSMMINPVPNASKINRDVYLPAGNDWFDFWTGEIYIGGKTILAEAPIDKIPIFVKAGSIIPMGPFIQYSNEKFPDPIELRIYGNADAEFEIYEDENDNYNYENGFHSIIKIRWCDVKRTLTIFDRKGDYPGMKVDRTFNVVFVKPNHGIGVEIENDFDRKINYSGGKAIIQF